MTLLFLSLQTHYGDGEYIIRQGARGDTFFIISKGKVTNLFIIEVHVLMLEVHGVSGASQGLSTTVITVEVSSMSEGGSNIRAMNDC